MAVASSHSEEDGLLVPLQLVDGVNTVADIQLALPLGAVSIVNDPFRLKILLQFHHHWEFVSRWSTKTVAVNDPVCHWHHSH